MKKFKHQFIAYPNSVSTNTADLLIVKIMFNNIISQPCSQFMCMNVDNFNLNTPMKGPEYMKIHILQIPDEIMKEYNLHNCIHNNYVYVPINKEMYGLPQAGILANLLLEKQLNKFRFTKLTTQKACGNTKCIPSSWF